MKRNRPAAGSYVFSPIDFDTTGIEHGMDFRTIDESQKLNQRLDALASLRVLLSGKMQLAFEEINRAETAGLLALTKNAAISAIAENEYDLASRLLDLLIELSSDEFSGQDQITPA